MEGQGNALKVGVVVVASVVMIVAAYAFVESEIMIIGKTYYVYGMFDDALGISEGMKVKQAGTNIGSVQWSRLSENGLQTRAKIRIEEDVALYENDEFVITQESLLGGNFIAISRDANNSGAKVKEEHVLKGTRQGGFNDIMQQTSSLMQVINNCMQVNNS